MRESRPEGRGRVVRLVAAAALLAGLPGCSSIKDAVVLDKPPPRVAVKGYQLELAYGKEPAPEVASTPAVRSVVDTFATLLDDSFDDLSFGPSFPPPRFRSLPPAEPCPPPTPSAVAERPITPDVKVSVEPGVYRWQNKGTLEFVGLAKTPLDGLSSRTVRNVTKQGTSTTFEVEAVAGTLRNVFRYRVDPGVGIHLVSLRSISGTASSTFTPALPVKMFTLPAVESTEVADVGVDPLTGTALVVQGRIVRKDRIEGCDELVDGWFVDATWTFIRPGALPSAWNYDYTVATQHGGLIVADRLQATQTLGPLIVNVDASSAFGSIVPKPES